MEAKQYAAVLTGAMRRLTEEDVTITAERIKQEVFPEAPLEGRPARCGGHPLTAQTWRSCSSRR